MRVALVIAQAFAWAIPRPTALRAQSIRSRTSTAARTTPSASSTQTGDRSAQRWPKTATIAGIQFDASWPSLTHANAPFGDHSRARATRRAAAGIRRATPEQRTSGLGHEANAQLGRSSIARL